jgi:hypothetical protein
MKKTFYLLSIFCIMAVLMSNKGNVKQGRESFDVTYVKSVSVTSARYVNTDGFRIKNITSDTVGLWVICRDNRDSIYWVFSPGWNPEVITVVCRQNKTVKIGQ